MARTIPRDPTGDHLTDIYGAPDLQAKFVQIVDLSKVYPVIKIWIAVQDGCIALHIPKGAEGDEMSVQLALDTSDDNIVGQTDSRD